MKKIKIVALFIAVLVALSVVICACGGNKKTDGNETTVGGNANENTTEKGGADENTTDKGGANENTTDKGGADEDELETSLGGYVESEVITFVEITIEEG